MKKYKNRILIGIFIAVLLIFAYVFGGEFSLLQSTELPSAEQVNIGESPNLSENAQVNAEEKTNQEDVSGYAQKPENNKTEENKDSSNAPSTDLQEKQKEHNILDEPVSTSAQETKTENEENEALSCTLSVRCDTILNNMSLLNSEKIEIVPKTGIIFAEQQVTFYEGESVFHLLLREMKKNKIHFEYTKTPIYNSAYVEGIANIYELDCGELSGWRYKVNGAFPNYGCSRYLLKEGDRVEWVYTCDFGADIGYSANSGGQKDE